MKYRKTKKRIKYDDMEEGGRKEGIVEKESNRRRRRRSIKEYKGRTYSNSPTGPNEAVRVARDESFDTIV